MGIRGKLGRLIASLRIITLSKAGIVAAEKSWTMWGFILHAAKDINR